MAGFFYNLGKLAGPKLRKAQWVWARATAPEAEAVAAEHRVGAEMAQAVRRMSRLCTDGPAAELLRTVGAQMKILEKNGPRTYAFECIDSDNPQAFCLPGGFIFVSSSMIDLCGRDPDILAFICAHEMAHVQEGHVMDRMLVNSVISTIARTGAVHAATGVLQKLGVNFLQSAYSQENEYHADELALKLMAAAGFDPTAALTLFDKLARFEHKPLLGKYFSTHPPGQGRTAALQKHLKNRTPGRPIP